MDYHPNLILHEIHPGGDPFGHGHAPTRAKPFSVSVTARVEAAPPFQSLPQHPSTFFWTTYFRFGFYSLVIPFHLEYERGAGKFHLHSSPLQQVLRVAVGGVLAGYFMLRTRFIFSKIQTDEEVRVGQPQNETHNPTDPAPYFDGALYLFDSFLVIITLVVFGAKGQAVCRALNRLQSSEVFRELEQPRRFQQRVLTALLCVTCFIVPASNFLEYFQQAGFHPSGFIDRFDAEAANVLAPIYAPSSRTARATFGILVEVGTGIVNTYTDLMFTVTVLLFRDLVNSLRALVAQAEEGGDEERPPGIGVGEVVVLAHYEWLKTLTTEVNGACAVMIFGATIGNLPFFATVFEVLLISNGSIKLKHVLVCTYSFWSLFRAADLSRRVEADMKGWLWRDDNHRRLEAGKLALLLEDLGTSPVTLKSYGTLAINYAQSASLVSVILTYGLIKIQLFHQ